MEIVITAENIEQGVCGSPTDCAVALAVKGAGYEGVFVANGRLKFEAPGVDGGLRRYHGYKIGGSLERFIGQFDAGAGVAPGVIYADERYLDNIAIYSAAPAPLFSGRPQDVPVEVIAATA